MLPLVNDSGTSRRNMLQYQIFVGVSLIGELARRCNEERREVRPFQKLTRSSRWLSRARFVMEAVLTTSESSPLQYYKRRN